MIKRAVITGLIWGLSATVLYTFLIVSGIYVPKGYIKWMNPFPVFIYSLPIFLSAALAFRFFSEKLQLKKWLSATIIVTITYIIVITPTALDDGILKAVGWETLVSAMIQILLLKSIDDFRERHNIKLPNKRSKLIFQTLLIALASFIVKTTFEVLIEWSEIMRIKVRAHRFGDTSESVYYIWYDFIVHFFLYILVTLLFYLILRYSRISDRLLILCSIVLLMFALLSEHRFQFLETQFNFPSEVDFNYKFVEEFIIYSLCAVSSIFLVKTYMLPLEEEQ